ncbi:MAG: hypothetical protein RLZZ618_3951 [Pseudomonadota bacterium]|jgi:aspartyl protease family protein
MRAHVKTSALALMLALSAAAGAQSVSMSGSLGSKALLMIDGTPRTLAVGSTMNGVKLLSVNANESVVEVGGARVTLRLGASQVNLGGTGSDGGGTRIVLPMGQGGHYSASGAINGQVVNFMVDTGATSVALSVSDAERLGIKLDKALRTMVHTANGDTTAHLVKLDLVRIGNVQVRNVEAVVVPGFMPHVLLGNSFLSRFDLTTSNRVMTLERRY